MRVFSSNVRLPCIEEAQNWVYLGCVKFYLERTTEGDGQGRWSMESKLEEKGSERVVGTKDVDWRFQCAQLFPTGNKPREARRWLSESRPCDTEVLELMGDDGQGPEMIMVVGSQGGHGTEKQECWIKYSQDQDFYLVLSWNK